MKFSNGTKSLFLFGLSVIFLVLITLFESVLLNLSVSVERIISALLLILPGLMGIVYGVFGVVRKETKVWVAYLGIVLNGLFVLFHAFVLSFAG